MHPNIHKNIDIFDIESLRKNTKKRKIFFAGNIKKDYESESIAIIHKKISRPNIIKFICDNFDMNKKIILNDLSHSNEYSNKIHIIDTNSIRIPCENWLNILSESHFFLACPGVRSPVCHNVVEAMAVGVIPILEYPEYFFPPLEDMSNCIVFKAESGLIKAVKKVLELPIEEIKIISKNVMKYYDNHLKQNNFIKNIEKANIKDLQLVVPMLCPHETVKIIS